MALSTTDQEVLIRNSIFGLLLDGEVTAVGANQFTIPSLAGRGVGKFMDTTNPYWAFVFRKGTGTSGAPQGQLQKITNYDDATGTFTTSAFTIAVAVGDEMLIVNPAIAQSILSVESRFKMVQSEAGTTEQNAFEMFTVVLFDVDTGAIPSANIDITGITAVMEKSTGGADFNPAGITQPIFLKSDGRVYCSYQFLLAEWAVGDLYRLTVNGIKATVAGHIVFVPSTGWCNLVLEAADLEADVDAIEASLGAEADAATLDNLTDITTTSAQAKIRRILLRLAPGVFQSIINGNVDTDLNAMLADLAAYFVAAGAAFSATINGGNPTDVNAALDALATYFKAAGAALDPTINGASPTDVSDALEALATYFKAGGAAFDPTVNGAAQADVSDGLMALAAYFNAASAALAVTIDNGGSSRTNLNDILTDLGAILNGAGITTFPAAAVPANGVNLAAAIRKIYDLANAIPDVQEVTIYPVAAAASVVDAVLDDSGVSPLYIPVPANSTVSNNPAAPGIAWQQAIDFEQAGTVNVVSIFAHLEWQTKFTVGMGAGTNSLSKIQISPDGGASWIDMTDLFTNPNAAMTPITREGARSFFTALITGVNQLQFRLIHYTDDAGGVSSSEAQVRENSYVTILYRKS